MKILIACEFSATVREAFKLKGHEAWSCDILPTEIPGLHYHGNVEDILYDKWDMIIAFPPCTYLCTTGNKWMKPEYKTRFPNRQNQRKNAINFFMKIVNANSEKIAIENPVGIMSTKWRKPDQYIHPYFFGEPHSKKTCLWLKGLPLLKANKMVKPKMYTYKNGKKDPVWHVESMKLPSKERAKIRSKTFPGIAKAMAEQWGKELFGNEDYK